MKTNKININICHRDECDFSDVNQRRKSSASGVVEQSDIILSHLVFPTRLEEVVVVSAVPFDIRVVNCTAVRWRTAHQV